MQPTRVWLTAVICTAVMYSQDQTGSRDALTNLDSSKVVTGHVLIEGVSPIGSVADVFVSVWEARIVGSPSSPIAKGIRMTLRDGPSASPITSTESIGLDEIDSTIKGIEFITKVDKSITNFSGITATYTTKRALRFEVYLANGSKGKGHMLAAVWTGRTRIVMDWTCPRI